MMTLLGRLIALFLRLFPGPRPKPGAWSTGHCGCGRQVFYRTPLPTAPCPDCGGTVVLEPLCEDTSAQIDRRPDLWADDWRCPCGCRLLATPADERLIAGRWRLGYAGWEHACEGIDGHTRAKHQRPDTREV